MRISKTHSFKSFETFFLFDVFAMMRAVLVAALLACVTAIPSLNFPGHEARVAVNSMEDTMHSEFVVWKAKVSIFVLHTLVNFSNSLSTVHCPRSKWPLAGACPTCNLKSFSLRDPLLDMVLDLAIPRPCRREAGETPAFRLWGLHRLSLRCSPAVLRLG